MDSENTLCYVNNWLIDVQSGSIIHQHSGEQKRLGEYQLKLLETLALHAGNVLSREQLTNLVWEGRIIGNNSLPNAIHALRLALDDDGKNQRIIKTIPKRGYLLEKEYCSILHSNIEQDLTDQAADAETTAAHDRESANGVENDEAAIDLSTRPSPPAKHGCAAKRRIIYCLLAVCLISVGASAYFYLNGQKKPNNIFSVKSVESHQLKNIEIHQVFRKPILNDSVQDPDKLSERLQSALTNIDNLLSEKNSKMHIYYRTANSILNLAFTIDGPCGRKELSMNIYHWRINNERLNTLIQKETERKLNETASCNV